MVTMKNVDMPVLANLDPPPQSTLQKTASGAPAGAIFCGAPDICLLYKFFFFFFYIIEVLHVELTK